MNAPAGLALPAIGTRLEGGFFAGAYMHGTERRGFVFAPKALGELRDVQYNKRYGRIDGALSFYDGLANTRAMAEAGSELASKILDLRIDGKDDWFLGALDQYELGYRRLKPGTQPNDCWARSGMNLSIVPPACPYTEDDPKQTDVELFRAGGEEAFDEKAYWTSTCLRAGGYYAWGQGFANGLQLSWRMACRLLARAGRSFPI